MAKRDEANTVPNACADAVTSKQPLKSYVPSQCEVRSMSFQMQPKIQSIMVSRAIGSFHYRSPYPEINAYLVVLAESRRPKRYPKPPTTSCCCVLHVCNAQRHPCTASRDSATLHVGTCVRCRAFASIALSEPVQRLLRAPLIEAT